MGKVDVRGAKVHTRHKERIIDSFFLQGTLFNIVNTKHGVYRILERKGMDLSDLGKIILSIGKDELEKHFNIARTHFNENMSWDRQIDYVISIYDVSNEIVLMIGLHPHLQRITIVTVIPRVFNVASNDVYATYRIDTKETVNKYIKHVIPKELEMQKIVI